jgi:hypothetical protein
MLAHGIERTAIANQNSDRNRRRLRNSRADMARHGTTHGRADRRCGFINDRSARHDMHE